MEIPTFQPSVAQFVTIKKCPDGYIELDKKLNEIIKILGKLGGIWSSKGPSRTLQKLSQIERNLRCLSHFIYLENEREQQNYVSIIKEQHVNDNLQWLRYPKEYVPETNIAVVRAQLVSLFSDLNKLM
jgi:hypothetical protein